MIKKIRYLTQFLFFALSVSIFLGVLTQETVLAVYYAIHIYPSLAQLAHRAVPAFFFVTVLILLLPILCGRLYCSFLCPVGFIQDVVGDLACKLGASQRSSLSTPWLSCFVLALCFLLLGLQSSFYGYLDHFSQFGRLLSLFREPLSISVFLGWFFLFLIVLLPVFYPRWFCSVLCPSGALFGLLGRVSFLRIEEKEECAHCSLCSIDCPAKCIDEGKIDFHQCVTCFQCVEQCGVGAFQLSYVWPRKSHHHDRGFQKGRREFLRNGAWALVGIAGGAGLHRWALGSDIKTLHTVLPPGGKSAKHFFSACTSCNICLVSCPTQVLVPSGLENGFLGVAKPKMDFDKSFCSPECNTCLQVCPTKAITFYSLEEKKRIKIGSAKLDDKLCIPYIKEQECVACQEHCPTGAISVDRSKVFGQPKVDDEFCIGCGACQFSCPVTPKKAIIVEPKAVHGIAKDPSLLPDLPLRAVPKSTEMIEGFPF